MHYARQTVHGLSAAGNRRNYYRVLHVQPEAPAEIVRASYRSLMTKLRHHPDRGGDHESAALLNEAYAVLSDPDRRRRYDETLTRAREAVTRGQPQAPRSPVPALPAPAKHVAVACDARGVPLVENPAAAAPPAAGGKTRLYAAAAPDASASTTHCAYCGRLHPASIRHDTRCGRCESPVAPPPGAAAGDASGCRRAAPRVAKSGVVLLQAGWREPVHRGRLRDLSVSGVSLEADSPVRPDAVMRIVGSSFDVIVKVVSCCAGRGSYALHARILTAIFAERAGTFVSLAV
ncbi:MAG: DnaJ domain-containing protein [Burkholderiales bacterium]|nr:DnaJ domain-containing protein [Burkholderiales bacterium]